MQLPKAIVGFVCLVILGAQIRVSIPVSRHLSYWYWPFLSYPMYAIAHEQGDSLLVSQLHVVPCDSTGSEFRLTASELGVSLAQFDQLLARVARDSDTASSAAAELRLSRVIAAQYPGRFCGASAWARMMYVADTSTHHLRAPMRRVATWTLAPLNEK